MHDNSAEGKRRLRVAHVSLGQNVGGMEKLLVEFAKHADRSHFELAFISLQSRGKLTEVIEECGWPTVSLNKPEGRSWKTIWKLFKELWKRRIDVVHTHNTAAFMYGVPAGKISQCKRIIHSRHGQRLNASSRETQRFVWLSRFASKIVSVSNDANDCSLQEGVPTNIACTIWNGIDIERFQFHGPRKNGYIAVVARLSPEKDLKTLLLAMKELVARRPSVKLEIAGGGAERENLEQLTRDLHLSENITFRGEINNVSEFLKGASQFVLPSLSEGISLTLLEAMSVGLPVVATNVGGNPEVVVDGATGQLVPVSNPTQLADALGRNLLNYERSRQMGNAGRQRVIECFDVRRMVKDYERLYVGDSEVENH